MVPFVVVVFIAEYQLLNSVVNTCRVFDYITS